MKRILSVILAILVCCSCFVSVFAVSAADATAAPEFKKLSVSSNTEGIRYIVDEDGNPVHLFGMARLLSAVQAGANEEFPDPADFAAKYKNLGLNYVRLAINVNDIGGLTLADGLSIKTYSEEDEEGNKELLSAVPMTDADIDAWIDETIAPEVDAFIAAGLYVCIDMHDYTPAFDANGEVDEEGNYPKLPDSAASAAAIIDYCEANYLRVLKRVAAKYKDNNAVMMIEIWNEPNYIDTTAPGNQYWEPALRDFFVDAVTALRGEGWDKILMVSDANAGWQHHTSTSWAGHFDRLYVNGNRNIVFSQHVGGGQLDESLEKNSAATYLPRVGAYAMKDNYCPFFNEVEAECNETNTEAGLKYFCDWLADTKEDYHYSAALWRPRTVFQNKEWVWGTNGWAADYTGGTLVIDVKNWFETDGSNLGAAWKKNQNSGISICYPDGDASVGLHEDGYAYTSAVKTNKSVRDIEFTRHWHYENNGAEPTDLNGGYDYIVMKIKFPTNGSYDWAMGKGKGNDEFIRVDEVRDSETNEVISIKATASFDDYKTIAKAYASELKAGNYIYLALPLSNQIDDLCKVVRLDPGFDWNDKGYSMHIATIDFATAEYVAANYAEYTPEGAAAFAEFLNTPKKVNFFAAAKPNGGDGANWAQNDYGHSISGVWGPTMGNTETGEYYAGGQFNSKAMNFRHGWADKPGADLSYMTYVNIRMKFNKTDANLDAALGMMYAGFIQIGDLKVSAAKAAEILTANKDLLLKGKYVDVTLPLGTTLQGEYKNIAVQFTDQWDKANNLGIHYMIESIDFGNTAYAEEEWLTEPKNIPMYVPGTTEFNAGGMTDAINYGGWGQQLRGIPMQILAPDYAITIAWADRALMMQKDWGEYNFNGMEYVKLTFKFNPELAQWAINSMKAPSDGNFATLTSDTTGTIATASYDAFKEALKDVTYDLLQGEYVTIYVPFTARVKGVGTAKTPKLYVNFGCPWRDDGAMRASILDAQVVNGKYMIKNEIEPEALENTYLKLQDGPDYTLTANNWWPQLSVNTAKNVMVNSTLTSVTLDIRMPDVETIRSLMTDASRGGSADSTNFDYSGNGFAIYFSGTNVTQVGISHINFRKALDENKEALKAGETVTVTMPISGKFTNGGIITGINMMIAHDNNGLKLGGYEVSFSNIYFNYNEETYFDTFDAADFDLDGAVSAADLVLAKKALFGAAVVIDNLSAGDVNFDGKADILDYVLVKEALLAE